VAELSNILLKFENVLVDDVMAEDWSRGGLKEGWRSDLIDTRTSARFATLIERFYNHLAREEDSDNNPPFVSIVGYKKFRSNVYLRIRWEGQLETTWESFSEIKKREPEALEEYFKNL